ncbi:hypothetical protein WICPIJ_006667, partial [Wickerhamomyces pijperi]
NWFSKIVTVRVFHLLFTAVETKIFPEAESETRRSLTLGVNKTALETKESSSSLISFSSLRSPDSQQILRILPFFRTTTNSSLLSEIPELLSKFKFGAMLREMTDLIEFLLEFDGLSALAVAAFNNSLAFFLCRNAGMDFFLKNDSRGTLFFKSSI